MFLMTFFVFLITFSIFSYNGYIVASLIAGATASFYFILKGGVVYLYELRDLLRKEDKIN